MNGVADYEGSRVNEAHRKHLPLLLNTTDSLTKPEIIFSEGGAELGNDNFQICEVKWGLASMLYNYCHNILKHCSLPTDSWMSKCWRNSASQSASGKGMDRRCFGSGYFSLKKDSGAADRDVASQPQRPVFDPDLGCCLCGVCKFLWLHGLFRVPPISQRRVVCRFIGPV